MHLKLPSLSLLVSCLLRADLLLTREPGVWALERAKQNVLENYLLVGILEELEDVLLLLERLLPHYFTGVLNIYKSPGTYADGHFRRNADSGVVVRSYNSFIG